jgi:hypothetical protein
MDGRELARREPFGITDLIEKIEECTTVKRRSSVFADPKRFARRPTVQTTRSDTP